MTMFKLGDEINSVICGWKWNQDKQTQENFLIGIQNYFTKCFNYYSMTPTFNLNGTITMGIYTVPCNGIFGTLSSFMFDNFSVNEWLKIIKPKTENEILNYKFYIRLSKVLKKFFEEKITLYVDAKGIEATNPIKIPHLIFNEFDWGKNSQRIMDNVSPDSHDDWIKQLNVIGDLIWINVNPITTIYTSPCMGGQYNGTLTVSFL